MGGSTRDVEPSDVDTGNPELDRDVATTVNAELEYRDYVREELHRRAEERAEQRQRKREQEAKQRQDDIEQYRDEQEAKLRSDIEDDALDAESNLGPFYARVESVDTVEPSASRALQEVEELRKIAKRKGIIREAAELRQEKGYLILEGSYTEAAVPLKEVEGKLHEKQFELKLKDHQGETFSHRLDFAPPDETGSEWVRLCEWIGVDPERPADLRGEIVPIKRPRREYRPDTTLHIPPVNGGLNPPIFRLDRAFHRLGHNDTVRTVGHLVGGTAPWWGSILGVLICGPLLLYSQAAYHSSTSLLASGGFLTVTLASVLGLTAALFGLIVYWGKAVLYALLLAFIAICRAIAAGWRLIQPYLFPQE